MFFPLHFTGLLWGKMPSLKCIFHYLLELFNKQVIDMKLFFSNNKGPNAWPCSTQLLHLMPALYHSD